MSEHRREMGELLNQARRLRQGRSQAELVEQAVRLADAHDDLEAGFLARMELIEAATFAGRPDVLLVAFTWCLAQCDAQPDNFDEGALLWKYKWVMDELPVFPQVSRRQIDEAFADMQRRYERAGSTLHAVHQMRRDTAVLMGDREAADRAHAQLARVRRDSLSNCQACVADAAVEYLALRGEDEAAVKNAEVVFSGRLRCAEVPQRTYALVLEPLLRLGRARQAEARYQAGYPLIADNPKFLRHVGLHLLYLARTDNLPRGVRLLERHLGDALTTASPWWQFEFFRAARVLLGRLRDAGHDRLALRLPADFELHRPDGHYDTAALAGWFDPRLADLADRFDTRNGNDHFRRRLAEGGPGPG
jgi:hypothetical protein